VLVEKDARMPWGLFGPVHFETRRGTRVTFFAGFITLPLTAWSLWKLLGSGEERRASTFPEKKVELLPELNEKTEGGEDSTTPPSADPGEGRVLE
jgi:hypothetical protein